MLFPHENRLVRSLKASFGSAEALLSVVGVKIPQHEHLLRTKGLRQSYRVVQVRELRLVPPLLCAMQGCVLSKPSEAIPDMFSTDLQGSGLIGNERTVSL